jgi:hypothetical protein
MDPPDLESVAAEVTWSSILHNTTVLSFPAMQLSFFSYRITTSTTINEPGFQIIIF